MQKTWKERDREREWEVGTEAQYLGLRVLQALWMAKSSGPAARPSANGEQHGSAQGLADEAPHQHPGQEKAPLALGMGLALGLFFRTHLINCV